MYNKIRNLASYQSSKLFIIFGIQGISAILGLAVQFLLARQMDVEEYGRFSIVFNAVGILTMIVSLGSSNYILRQISIYHQQDLRKTVNEFNHGLSYLTINWFILTIVCFGIHYFFIKYTQYNFSLNLILLSAFWILFGAYSDFLQKFDRATGNPIRSMLPTTVIKSGLLIFAILIFIFYGFNITAKESVSFYLFSFVLVAILFFIYEYQYINIKEAISKPISNYKRNFNVSYEYFINKISQNLLKNLDLIFIGIYLTDYDAGVYGAATRINLIIIFGLSSLNILYSPLVAKLFKQNEINKLNKSLKRPNLIIFLFSGFLFLLIVVLGDFLLHIFGDDYVSGYWILILLSARNLIEAFFGITGNVLNMSGNQTFFNKILYFLLGSYIILSPFVIGYGGLIGFALFVLLIALVKNIIQWKFIYYNLGIHSGLFSNLYFKIVSK